VNNFFDAFSGAEVGVVALAGCFRFLDEPDEELTSSGFARNDEVPGIPSLAAAVELDPFAAVVLFREFDFSPSILGAPLDVGAALLRLADFACGCWTSKSTSRSRSSA
jgi:hypothetical protein